MSILDQLNDKQREAGEKIDGALLILAGAGSGKTRTITYRIAHMVMEKGISPYKILAVTFTNKAAKEMRERVERLMGEDARKTTISTFHSFGIRILRVYGEKIGYNSNFSIYDTDDQKRVVRGIIKKFGIIDKKLTESYFLNIISNLKEQGISPEEYEKDNPYQPNIKKIVEVYLEYQKELKNSNGMDFSDILYNTYKVLEIPEILDKIREKYRYIMVDEYQDTNHIQYKIINMISKKYGNICVVGDENQSIYRFRGADIRNILDFEKDYPDAKIVKLEENYRSTGIILEAANSVIKNNTSSLDKRLWTKNKEGEKISFKMCRDGREEANYVVDKIKELKKIGKNYSDFTILYRTNAQSRNFEEVCLRENIPYKIFGGMQFYQRAEVKDILAYLAFINNKQDSISLNRIINVPKRKIGEKTLEKIKEYSQGNNISLFEGLKNAREIAGVGPSVAFSIDRFIQLMDEIEELQKDYGKVSEIYEKVVTGIGYFKYLEESYEGDFENRVENVKELGASIYELEKVVETLTLREYLENVTLVSATDSLDEDAEYVKIMTIHNSKGLEFPNVFLTGVEDEIFPGRNATFDRETEEEERRLCYVAITRAEEHLFLSYAQMRFMYGQEEYRSQSRFVKEIPETLLKKENEVENIGSQHVKGESKGYINRDNRQKNILKEHGSLDNLGNLQGKEGLFKKGEKVFHKKFGIGVIKGENDKVVMVDFVDGTKEIALILADKFLTKQ